jgi:Mg-chelatase subunit ChlD
MKKIDIICILDMSGSMSSIMDKAREGFNKFLNEQKQSKNKIKFSLVLFDTDFYMPYKNVSIKKVKEVNEDTYYARGGTSLYDTIGVCADDYFDYLASNSKDKRADKTLFVILTDGKENSSRVYHKEYIKNIVTEMQEEFDISFIYLGANQDACFVAESMGIKGSNSFNYDATGDGITVAYANISKATSYYASTDVKENLFQQ